MAAPLARDADLPDYARSLIRIKVRRLCLRREFSRTDQEDLEQELAARLVQQWPLFDPDRGALTTFIARVVDSAIKMILRDRHRKKRGGGRGPQSLDVVMGVDETRPITGAELLNEDDHARRLGREVESESVGIERRMDVQGVLANLPPNLKDLCRRLVHGTEAGVARDLGISLREVRRLRGEVRMHFEAAGIEKNGIGGQLARGRHK